MHDMGSYWHWFGGGHSLFGAPLFWIGLIVVVVILVSVLRR